VGKDGEQIVIALEMIQIDFQELVEINAIGRGAEMRLLLLNWK
jgi:hypothetical protein